MKQKDKTMKEKFNILTATCVPLPLQNVDTDQIIPARFLKATDKKGFGDNLFRDWRYDKQGNKTSFVLNDPTYADSKVLVGGKNFGSGSSREHAGPLSQTMVQQDRAFHPQPSRDKCIIRTYQIGQKSNNLCPVELVKRCRLQPNRLFIQILLFCSPLGYEIIN